MTIEDCKEAIRIKDKLRLYIATLDNNRDRNFIETERISTGIGEATITLVIPWEYCQERITADILTMSRKLTAMGIDFD